MALYCITKVENTTQTSMNQQISLILLQQLFKLGTIMSMQTHKVDIRCPTFFVSPTPPPCLYRAFGLSNDPSPQLSVDPRVSLAVPE